MNDINQRMDANSFAYLDIAPAFDNCNVPIVFCADESYLPFLKVTLSSILANTTDRNLDILIFHNSLPAECQNLFISSYSNVNNLSIRFLDVKNIVDATQAQLYTSKNHLSIAALYRLFLPYVLTQYDKVLYLDVDLIVCDNIGNLYDIDLNDNLLGGCKDIAFKDWILKRPGYVDFARKYGFDAFDDYINTGVLLFNCKAFREQREITIGELINIAIEGASYYVDQEAFNFCCKGKIEIVSPQWNFIAIQGKIQSQVMHRNGDYKIVHYASSVKPWNHPEHIYAHLWWKHIDIAEGVKLWRKIFSSERDITIGDGISASVVIPIYNAGLYLPMMLISLAAQTLQNIEILCINDGSKDNSKEICEKFSEFDSRFRVISQPNSGAAIARNRGIEESKGKWLFFSDADDFCKPNMLEEMVQEGEKNQLDIVVAGRFIVDVRNDISYDAPIPKEYLIDTNSVNCHTPGIDVFRGLGFAPWNKLYLRDFIINENIIFHQTPPQDDVYFVLMTLILAKHIVFLNNYYYYYRSNLTTSQVGNVDKNPTNFLVALKEVHDRILNEDTQLQHNFYQNSAKSCFANLASCKTLEGLNTMFRAIQDYGLEVLRFPNINEDELDLGIYKTAYEYTKGGCTLEEVLSAQYRLISDRVKILEVTLHRKDVRIAELLSRIKDKDVRIKDKDVRIAELLSRIKDKDVRIKDKDVRIAELLSRIKDKDVRIKDKDSRIAELLSRIKDKDVRIAEILDGWKLAREKIASMNSQMSQIFAKQKQLQEQNSSYKIKIEDLGAKVHKLEATLIDIDKQFTNEQKRSAKLKASLIALRKEHKKLQRSRQIWRWMFFIFAIILIEWFFFIYW